MIDKRKRRDKIDRWHFISFIKGRFHLSLFTQPISAFVLRIDSSFENVLFWSCLTSISTTHSITILSENEKNLY